MAEPADEAGAAVRLPRTSKLILYGTVIVTDLEVSMATKVTVELQDDLDGGPADETVHFELAGSAYEIDLSKKNGTRFRAQLAPFIEHARKAATGQRRRAARNAFSRVKSNIRAWANDQGIPLNARGRIPTSIIDR